MSALPELCIKITFDPPAEKYARSLAYVTRAAFEAVAEHWHRRFLRLHFQEGARSRYGFLARSPSYERRKRGRPDLVYRGIMQNMMQSPPTIRAFPTRANLKMAAPAYVEIRPRNPKRPNMYSESKRIIPAEREELRLVARLRAVEQLKNLRQKRVVLINGD